MKLTIKTSLLAVSLFAVMAVFAQKPTTETFKVNGNCGMCKKNIESAVATQPGVSKAIWDKKSHVMKVTFVSSKITLDAIQKKIADAGYDTPKYRGDDKAYSELEECCQYDREDAKKGDEHGGH